MGVTGLWTIAHPCARPVRLETLAHKRLAVDASIWIYQFLKAVRDKDGNALRSSHVVGFFRRICKLLFFGIRPVFVFDGGAPALKRQTIAGRKLRREGRKEDARRTAKRILALQVQRSADVEAERRKNKRAGRVGGDGGGGEEEGEEEEEEGVGDAELVYVDELLQMPQERMEKEEKKKPFRKADPYHLPDLDVNLENMGAPNDPRIMSQEDLEEYARQFRGGEEVNLYDFSKIDFDSAFFNSLPAADRYNILNAARLRSRMRMGLAKEQLDAMFPNRMDFSRFQIERVAERNNLTQRLMNLNGMNEGIGGTFDPTRVAGEKGREYVLVKNDGVEGGWVLGVVGHAGEREGERNKPIVVDVTEKVEDDEDIDGDEEDFEDVPVEGLNRLPHVEFREDDNDEQSEGSRYDAFDDVETQMLRQALYQSRKEQSTRTNANLPNDPAQDRPPTEGLFNFNNPLFLDEGDDDPFPLDEIDEQQQGFHDDDEQLQRAIQMSLEPSRAYRGMELESAFFGRDLSDIEEVEEEEETIGKGKGKAVEKFPIPPRGLSPVHVAVPGDSDFQRAVSESRRMAAAGVKPSDSGWNAPGESSKSTPLNNPFGGLLPFEPLSLGSKSFLIKKKKPEEEKEKEKEKEKEEEKPALLPPWFAGGPKDLKEEMRKANQVNVPSTTEVEAEEKSGLVVQRVPRGSQSEKGLITIDPQAGDEIIIDTEDESDEDMLDAHSMEGMDLKTDDAVDRMRAQPSGTAVPEPPALQDEREKPGTSSPAPKEKALGTQESDLVLKWEESDHEDAVLARKADAQPTSPSQRPTDTSYTSPPPPGFSEQEVEPLREISPPLEDDDDQYMDPEDLELIQQLALESEEHARFAAELNNKPQQQTREEYERELKSLRNQQAKDRRDADEVTLVMVQECQQLLTLFGIPYITAPMEAEAQCAELVRLGLVDGIITDDSDTFLFGGTRIYKNMFNQSKYVECYLASDLEREFALDRGRLIRIAHLLGSDYTEGIPSVGPVTALELLAEFSSDDGLAQFRDWWAAVQTGLSKPTDDAGSKFRKKFVIPSLLPPSLPPSLQTLFF